MAGEPSGREMQVLADGSGPGVYHEDMAGGDGLGVKQPLLPERYFQQFDVAEVNTVCGKNVICRPLLS